MFENHSCTKCSLHQYCSPKSVCLKGEGGDSAKLAIFLDNPGMVEDRRHRGFVSDGAKLLVWLLERMSLAPTDYYLDYVLKCHPGKNNVIGQKAYRQSMIELCSEYRIATLQKLRPAAIVAMGTKACEAFIGAEKVGQYEGSTWIPTEPRVREIVPHVWISYGPAYALEDPSNTVSIYRTLFAAAEEAGLSPEFNPNLKMTDAYGT